MLRDVSVSEEENWNIVLLNICSLTGKCERYGRVLWLHRQGFFFGTLVPIYENKMRPILQSHKCNIHRLHNSKRHTRNLQFSYDVKIKPWHLRIDIFVLPNRCQRCLLHIVTVINIKFICIVHVTINVWDDGIISLSNTIYYEHLSDNEVTSEFTVMWCLSVVC
jgi:hypothetical protein